MYFHNNGGFPANLSIHNQIIFIAAVVVEQSNIKWPIELFELSTCSYVKLFYLH